MKKDAGLKPLGRVWLEELGLMHRLLDDATESERARMIAQANTAAAKVDAAFEALHRTGKLRMLSKTYRLHVKAAKAKGAKPRPWGSYALGERRRMVRALAREQVSRARRGLPSG